MSVLAVLFMCISLQQIGSYQTYCTKEELNRMKALKTPTSLKSLMSSKGSCFLLRLPLLLGRIPLDGCSVANEHLGIYRIYSILLKQYFKVSVSFGYCNWVCPCSVIGCIEVALCLCFTGSSSQLRSLLNYFITILMGGYLSCSFSIMSCEKVS